MLTILFLKWIQPWIPGVSSDGGSCSDVSLAEMEEIFLLEFEEIESDLWIAENNQRLDYTSMNWILAQKNIFSIKFACSEISREIYYSSYKLYKEDSQCKRDNSVGLKIL